MKVRRRTMLAGSLATAWVGVAARAEQNSPADLEIIDCHTHFYDPSRPEGIPWPAKGSPLYRTVLPKHLREQQTYRRLTGTVIVEASPRIEDNAWLLDLAHDDPFVVGIVGHLDPAAADFAKRVERFAANPLFRGIRVSVQTVKNLLEPKQTAALHPLLDHDLSLDVNGGPETPSLVAELAAQLPKLRIVQNHIGNVHITAEKPPRSWQAGIQAAAKQTNVFCKISALLESAARMGKQAPTDLEFYRPYLDVVWDAFGDHRVIYGSNWPVCERACDYATQQRIVMEYASEKGNSATIAFCSANAKQAYRWLDRPGR